MCLQSLRATGLVANGRVGDADPLLAIEDALRIFPANEILIATHPEGRSNWLARNIVGRARARYRLPVQHLVVDSLGGTEFLAASSEIVASGSMDARRSAISRSDPGPSTLPSSSAAPPRRRIRKRPPESLADAMSANAMEARNR